MKNLRTFAIIFGIAIVSLFTNHANAEDLKKKAGAKKNEIIKLETAIYDAKMRETEQALLEDYLQVINYESAKNTVAIISTEGKTILAGDKTEAKDLLKNAEFLFSFGEQEHYLLIE